MNNEAATLVHVFWDLCRLSEEDVKNFLTFHNPASVKSETLTMLGSYIATTAWVLGKGQGREWSFSKAKVLCGLQLVSPNQLNL